jgi:hypothetical protein
MAAGFRRPAGLSDRELLFTRLNTQYSGRLNTQYSGRLNTQYSGMVTGAPTAGGEGSETL